MAGNQESSTTRTRSLDGCSTCRRRHMKCDEMRPTCSTCQKYGLDCGGYQRAIFFDTELPSDLNPLRFRRPLFTENERKCMSALLLSSVPSKSTLKVLSQIDEKAEEFENADNDPEFQIQRGPFGVFTIHQPQVAKTILCRQIDPHAKGSTDTAEEDLTEFDSTLLLWNEDLEDDILGYQNILTAHRSESWGTEFENSMDALFQDIIFPTSPFPDALSESIQPSPESTWTIPSMPLVMNNNIHSVPEDAILLLKHYTAEVITLLTPFRHSKTPWHVLFIPHIKNCLAALSLGEQLDYASLTAFYGTLAVSAMSLGGISQSQRLISQGKEYRDRAECYAALALKYAYKTPKSAKYKSTVMALLVMMHVSMFAADREKTDHYLLEVEKFIRLKGLNRRKSRKVRLLHHCYVFERLFHESTYMQGRYLGHRLQVQASIESSGLAIHSHDSLTFRLPAWKNFDTEMSQVKNQLEGENDLHLEKLGDFPPTLYPEIFGIPESWILLLSLIIRLGNEKDAAGRNGIPSNLGDFMSQAKAIETRITHLQLPVAMENSLTSLLSLTDHEVMGKMLEAMQQALAIYFYRRIYDIDASMLQIKVKKVRDCLECCDEVDSTNVHGSVGFIWPAFIAACEAQSTELQASFSRLFKTSSQRSGLSCFTDTLRFVERVWHERKISTATSISWLDVMSQNS